MPVKAAPAAVAAAPSWSGFYVGLFAGYGWGRAKATAPFDSNTGFFYNFLGNAYAFDADGFFGGGTVGYNMQSGAIVFGLEGEVGYLGLKGSAIEPNDLPASADTVTRFKSDIYGAIYGRARHRRRQRLVLRQGRRCIPECRRPRPSIPAPGRRDAEPRR